MLNIFKICNYFIGEFEKKKSKMGVNENFIMIIEFSFGLVSFL